MHRGALLAIVVAMFFVGWCPGARLRLVQVLGTSLILAGACDPKPEKQAIDKLSLTRPAWSSGVRRGGPEGGEEGTHGRADFAGIAPGGRRHESGRHLPRAWVSEATYYVWKKKYSGLGLSELRELRQLREENAKLKRLVADLSLDRHMLQEIVQKKL